MLKVDLKPVRLSVEHLQHGKDHKTSYGAGKADLASKKIRKGLWQQSPCNGIETALLATPEYGRVGLIGERGPPLKESFALHLVSQRAWTVGTATVDETGQKRQRCPVPGRAIFC